MCDHSRLVYLVVILRPLARLGSACSSSPSDLMTRLSQRGWRMPRMSNSFREVFSFRFRVSSHVTQHRAQMCHVKKNGWRKSVRHPQERHPHEGLDERSRAAEARVPKQYTPQHVREDAGRGDVGFNSRAGSARTEGDDPMEIGAVGKERVKRLRDPEPPCRSRVLLLSPQGPHQRGVQNSYRRREGQQVQGQERTNGSGKRKRNE